MELFPEIDERKTINNVKRWLDKNFERMVLESGLSSMDLRSPTISDMPSSAPVGNSNERKVTHMMIMQDELKKVLKSFNCYSKTSSIIMKSLYIDKLDDWQIELKIGFGKTQYFKLKNKAFLEFASAMEAYDYHLTIYKKEKNY